MTHLTHAHITTWVIAIILLFVALAMHNSGKTKGFKIVHMINRVFYILIILTGGALMGSAFGFYWLKMVLGFIVIAAMEMILVRTKKGKSTGVMWALFVIVFLIIGYYGFFILPKGV
ncbi:YisL family protein [Bacillus cihuensis]|uniref:YisL family protein n=1 Tax=Bacillus cihuensis TaxID=1208599 RepID=UPI0003F61A7B|nr:YisL family protein [Bacillus cihuensis]